MITRREISSLLAANSVATIAGAAPAASTTAAPLRRDDEKTKVTILLYPGVTMLDWIGPYELLHRVPGIDLVLAAKDTRPMKSDSDLVTYQANTHISEIDRSDVLLIPGGGMGTKAASEDETLIAWIRKIDANSLLTTSVCTGSLILARTGLIKGRKATTHWALQHMLSDAGSTYVPERWVVDGKYWTSAGVSAGMDMSLALIARLYGAKRAMMTQLMVEYEPAPPSIRVRCAQLQQISGRRLQLRCHVTPEPNFVLTFSRGRSL